MVSLIEAGYLAIAFVVFVVSVSIGGQVLASVQSGQGTVGCINLSTNVSCWTTAYNATGSGLTGIANLATQSGTIGTILGAIIIIGLLMGAFMINKQNA